MFKRLLSYFFPPKPLPVFKKPTVVLQDGRELTIEEFIATFREK